MSLDVRVERTERSMDYSKFTIFLANGEKNLYNQLQKKLDENVATFTLKMTNLCVGDILICHHDPNYETNPALYENLNLNTNQKSTQDPHLKPMIMIERKRIADFCSSFTSGHYQNQKDRMIAFAKQTGCQNHLVVEGYQTMVNRGWHHIHGKPVTTLEQCFTSIMVRDKFNVTHVADEEDHAKYILQCIKTLEKYKLYEGEFEHDKDYLSTLKLKKKANLTPETFYMQTLANIPMFSMETAEYISQTYPSLIHLIKELETHSTTNIENIKIGKNKLGKVKSERLLEFIIYKPTSSAPTQISLSNQTPTSTSMPTEVTKPKLTLSLKKK